MPAAWRFTMSGLTNDGSRPDCDCSGFNGTFTLSLVIGTAPSCVWDGLHFNVCGAGDPNWWRLTCVLIGGVPTSVTLFAKNGETPTWSIPYADFSCLGVNVLTLDMPFTGPCDGTPPATVTIIPA